MHGCGNDFILVDGPWSPDASRVRALCDRRTGIGADGVIVVDPVRDGRWPVTVHNSDGSIADACGNGYRCVGRYLLERHGGDAVVLGTPAGDVRAWREDGAYALLLPPPRVEDAVTVEHDGATLAGRSVRVGNPNVVLFVDEPNDVDLERVADAARALRGPANVGVAAVRSRDLLSLRVHERGAGETLACGTGSCAAVAAAIAERHVAAATVAVDVPGGRLRVTPRDDGWVLQGPAERVFEGTLP